MKLMKKLLACMLMLAMLIPVLPVFEQRAEAATSYYIEVDVTNQIVTVYLNSNRTESGIVRQMICSTGKNDKTPRGTFTMPNKTYSSERTEWHALYGAWGKWCTRITGHILFHSVPYSTKNGTQSASGLKALGTAASLGCIRLRDADAYWIAKNCLPGTKVRIYKSYAVNKDLRELLLERSFSIDSESYEEYLGIASALAEGSTGEEVMQLQARLNLLGYAAGKADGVFGAKTTAAVKAFQAEKGLSQNGRVTQRLWDYIFADNAPYAPVVIGSSGLHVKELQEALKVLKLYTGAITGVYDNATANAVRLYQSAYGMTVNGKATNSVRKAIVAKAAEVAKKFGDSDYKAVVVSSSKSMAKVNVSSKLNLRKSASTSSKSLATMSNGTVLTVLKKGSTWTKVQYGSLVGYCKNSYLKFYTETNNSLDFEAVVPDPAATPTPTPDPNATPKPVASTDTLEIGSEGEAVVNLQRALKELCFYTGELTGVYDEATAAAVKTFQKYNSLTVNGIADTAVQVWALDIAEEIKAQFGDAEYKFTVTETTTTTAKVKVSSSLILRKKASTSSAKLTSLKNGTVVTVLSKGSTWSKVQYGSKVGYLMNKYLTFTTKTNVNTGYVVVPTPDPNATPTPTPDPNATPKPVASAETLTVGSKGSAVSQLQRALAELKLYKGEITGTYDDATAAAVKVFQAANGLTVNGKASTAVQTKILDAAETVKNQFSGSDYKATVTETTTTKAKVKVSSSLNLRKKASTSSTVLTKLKNGTVVTVLSKGSSWSKVEYKGIVGYCKNTYLTFSTTTSTTVTYEALPTPEPTATPEPTPTVEPTPAEDAAATEAPAEENTLPPVVDETLSPDESASPAPDATETPAPEVTDAPVSTATAVPKVQYAVVKEDATALYTAAEAIEENLLAAANAGEYFEVIEITDEWVSVKYEGKTAYIPANAVEIVDEEPIAEIAPVAEATSTAEATAAVESTPATEETPAVESTPTAEATPAAEVTPNPEATPTVAATATAASTEGAEVEAAAA